MGSREKRDWQTDRQIDRDNERKRPRNITEPKRTKEKEQAD